MTLGTVMLERSPRTLSSVHDGKESEPVFQSRSELVVAADKNFDGCRVCTKKIGGEQGDDGC